MANVVLPGTMDTPANRKSMPDADFSKWVQPKDVAELVLSLSDVRARHMTGVAVPIEGEVFERIAVLFVDALSLYVALGVVFAVAFVCVGVKRIDSQAVGTASVFGF
jgi:hypothetical protein